MRTRVLRVITLTIAGVIALLGLLVVAGLPVYVTPYAASVTHADLAYVIGPPTRQRIAEASDLYKAGLVDRILVSVPRNGGMSAAELSVCQNEWVDCRHPTPFTTKGEADLLGSYARTNHIDRTIVLTFTPHVSRARYIFQKCYPGGDVTVVAVPTRLTPLEWAYQYLYQSAAFVKAWATPCNDAGEL